MWLRWTSLVLIVIMLISYLSPIVSPDFFWPIAFAGLIYLWLLFALTLLTVYWAIRKDRYFFYTLTTILIGWGHLSASVAFHLPKDPPPGKMLKVATYNVNNLVRLRIKDRKKNYEKAWKAFPAFLEQFRTLDLLCAQESSVSTLRFLKDSLGFPYVHTFSDKAGGPHIFSRKKFIHTGKIPFQNLTNTCIWADIAFGKDTIRVYNVHLQSNGISSTADKLAEKGSFDEKETWRDIRKIMAQYKYAAQRRASQSRRLAAHMRQSPYPVVLCGDLNDPPLSYPYRVLSEGLQDSFKECGFGIGTTYAGHIPALRIDYIFADSRFEIIRHKVPKLNLSDHYPVMVVLKIR
ncbi:MAG: hypothetical protein D6714_09720 [Bacteroidetes bacterium]|nr:MAG: hypothetical protein D6714_09720 [Bacteroidota bacterium]